MIVYIKLQSPVDLRSTVVDDSLINELKVHPSNIMCQRVIGKVCGFGLAWGRPYRVLQQMVCGLANLASQCIHQDIARAFPRDLHATTDQTAGDDVVFH